MTTQRYQVLIPGTWDCYLTRKKVFVSVIELQILKWGDSPKLSGRAPNHRCLTQQGRRGHGARGRPATWSWEGGGVALPKPPGGCSSAKTMILAQWYSFLTLGFWNSQRINFCCKPPSFWSSVRMATGESSTLK